MKRQQKKKKLKRPVMRRCLASRVVREKLWEGTVRCHFTPPGRANIKKIDIGSAGVGSRDISAVPCCPWDESWACHYKEQQRPERLKMLLEPPKDVVGPGAQRSGAPCSRAPSNVVAERGLNLQAPMRWDLSQDARCDVWAASHQNE